jgi:GNAT superfamily N-acetyltransferase
MGANNGDFAAGHGGGTTINYLPHTDKNGNSMHAFQMRDAHDNLLGHLNLDSSGMIQQIETRPEFRRQGIATALYNHAVAASQTNPAIPTPRHSGSRTPSGNAWTKAVTKKSGEELVPQRTKVSPSTYTMRAAMWEMMLPLSRGE